MNTAPASTKAVKPLAAIVLLVILFAGCSISDTGTLVIGLWSQIGARTIEPDNVSMTVHHYVVHGSGPRGDEFRESVTDGSVVRTSLTPGPWNITVDAYNAAESDGGVRIGTGTATLVVDAGGVTHATLPVRPLTGDGVFFLAVRIPIGVVTSPTFAAALDPVEEGRLPIPLDLQLNPVADTDPGFAQYEVTNSAVDAGYYKLTLTLSDDSTLLWGTVEAVRIITGQDTEAEFVLVEDVNRVGLTVNFGTDLRNPFDISLDLEQDTSFIEGDKIEITAAAEGVAVDRWRWFLHATEIEAGLVVSDGTSSTVDLNGLEPGYYEVSVLAEAGSVLSSTIVGFEVQKDPGAVGRIVYVSYAAGFPELWTINADGSGASDFVPGGQVEFDPRWSPDGTKVVFSSNRDSSTFEIYVASADGQVVERVTQDGFNDRWPAWSPDGTQIVYSSLRNGNYDLYVMDADGSNPRAVTTDPGNDLEPTWSPDGSSIAFVSTRVDGVQDIWNFNLSSGVAVRLTNDSANESAPDYAPDGDSIVYGSVDTETGSTEIYLVRTDGTGVSAVTSNGAENRTPRWSPDGAQILFASNLDGDSELYRMPIDGSRLVQITANGHPDQSPSWTFTE